MHVHNVNILILLIVLLIMFWVVVQTMTQPHIVHIVDGITELPIIIVALELVFVIALGTPPRLMEKTMTVTGPLTKPLVPQLQLDVCATSALARPIVLSTLTAVALPVLATDHQRHQCATRALMEVE